MSETPLPAWAAEIRQTFTSGAASMFLLHGVRDVFPYQGLYLPLSTYLHHVFCGDKHTVCYDIAQGITFPTPEDESKFLAFLNVLRVRRPDVPEPAQAYRPEIAIPILEEFLFTRDSAAVIIDYADKLAPREDLSMMTFDERRLSATLRRWAQDPRLLRRNSFVFLVAEALSSVDDDLYARGGGAHVVEVRIADEGQRREYIDYVLANPQQLSRGQDGTPPDTSNLLELPPAVLAQQTNGL
ncbi:MAG: hypothetical protein WCP21_05670, partial [Armatimonadota bacterium]